MELIDIADTALNQYIDLSSNTELRTLHLLILDLRDELMPWVTRVLAEIGAPHLERLKFDVWLYDARQLASQHWNEISWMLSHPRYLSIQEVRFVHRGVMEMPAAAKALRRRMDALDRRNVLAIEDGRMPLCASLVI